MCGLIGYIGNNAVAPTLLSGLKNLEYRGYDSAGIALNDNHVIDVFKAKGKLDNLKNLLENQSFSSGSSHLGIGHIRWATHGKATTENAHPHLSNDGKLVLVHNGIIENYQELRKMLQDEGFVFHSETDTETAVHLIDREYKKSHSLEPAVIAAVKMLRGAFAFCIMHQNEPDKIIAVRKNAPLIVGIGNNENYIASDIPAIIAHWKSLGLQYDILLNEKRILTFGATYQPEVNLRPNMTRVIYSTNIGSAAVVDSVGKENFYLPHMYNLGLSFQSMRFSASVDYSSQLWSGSRNVDDVLNSIEFKNSQYFKVGFQYTPNPGDARRVLNRWSYRLGFRFGDYYMRINEHNIYDKAITAGVGIPLRSAFMGTSAINVGVEFGWRGRTQDGMIGTRQFRMVQEKYFKISVGLSLFGEDDWFKRFKYQ